MSNELERLPLLIERAAAALANATSAAEVLDASQQAEIAYTNAKMAARLSKVRNAHATVLAACRKAMADALMIEARAQCRLADEYDAAQERGEVILNGRPRKTVPDENVFLKTKTADIGLTRKQVHEARQVRDAEQARPGIVRETLDAKLQAGEEPTRADVKRAVKGNRSQRREGQRGKGPSPALDKARKIVREKLEANEPISPHKLQDQHGVSHVTFDMAITAELARKEALDDPEIDQSTLSISQQQKNEAWRRQELRRLEAQFDRRVSEEVRRRIDEIVLPAWKERVAEARKLYDARRGIWDKATHNLIWSCLHPDSRHSTTDKKLADAFNAFNSYEKRLLAEKDSPTTIPEVPDNLAAWERMKTAAREGRRSKGNAVGRRA